MQDCCRQRRIWRQLFQDLQVVSLPGSLRAAPLVEVIPEALDPVAAAPFNQAGYLPG